MYKRGTSAKIGMRLNCGGYVKDISHKDNSGDYVFICVCKCGEEFLKRGNGSMKKSKGCKNCSRISRSSNKYKDITGKEWDNGTYVVSLNKIESYKFGIYWNIYCASCGEIYIDNTKRILKPAYPKKCFECTKKGYDLTGYKFGLGCKVICEVPSFEHYNCRRWLYECKCGNLSVSTKHHITHTLKYCRFCSTIEAAKAISGAKHYNYNPNLTDEDRAGRSGYNRWRRQVLKKYNNRCIISGKSNVLQIHHIYNYAQHKNLRVDVDNGVPLQKELHKLFHEIYGVKDNNLTQLQEFVEMCKR